MLNWYNNLNDEQRVGFWEAVHKIGYLAFMAFVYFPLAFLAGLMKHSD